MNGQGKKAGLVEVVRWVVNTLIGLAQAKGYGTIRITVQRGQIEFVHLDQSWNLDNLPANLAGGGPAAAVAAEAMKP